jgi:endonuclease/exonuclease/phosphatase family metal-dependent hydrolase
VNLHLDPYGEFLESQIQQLHTFIGKISTSKEFETIAPSSCGVVFVGDWNFSESTSQYSFLQKAFHGGLRDLYFEFHNQYDPTFDATNNSFIPWRQVARIDHVFALDQLQIDSRTKLKFLSLRCENIEIKTQKKGEEWSDHWAQVTKLTPNT